MRHACEERCFGFVGTVGGAHRFQQLFFLLFHFALLSLENYALVLNGKPDHHRDRHHHLSYVKHGHFCEVALGEQDKFRKEHLDCKAAKRGDKVKREHHVAPGAVHREPREHQPECEPEGHSAVDSPVQHVHQREQHQIYRNSDEIVRSFFLFANNREIERQGQRKQPEQGGEVPRETHLRREGDHH